MREAIVMMRREEFGIEGRVSEKKDEEKEEETISMARAKVNKYLTQAVVSLVNFWRGRAMTDFGL